MTHDDLVTHEAQYVSLAGITLAGGSRKMSGYSPIFTTNSEQPPEQLRSQGGIQVLMDCKIDHCRSLTHKKCHHGTGSVQIPWVKDIVHLMEDFSTSC